MRKTNEIFVVLWKFGFFSITYQKSWLYNTNEMANFKFLMLICGQFVAKIWFYGLNSYLCVLEN